MSDINVAVEDLVEAVRKERTPPNGVKVSVGLWGELRRANKSEEIDFCPIGKA
ncbi:MAG: hypothetical protein U5Q16_10335 [Gammaproteobacteria bacterium]|nr:hypothetical protein [Gammaproteobacteria bacterium]